MKAALLNFDLKFDSQPSSLRGACLLGPTAGSCVVGFVNSYMGGVGLSRSMMISCYSIYGNRCLVNHICLSRQLCGPWLLIMFVRPNCLMSRSVDRLGPQIL